MSQHLNKGFKLSVFLSFHQKGSNVSQRPFSLSRVYPALIVQKFQLLFYLILFVLIKPAISKAQTCNGSLGEPVVNISFGTGYASASPLKNNITSYTYSSSPCPGDGFYNIVTQTQGCFGNTWHSATDHTPGDINGNMMLINASFTAGDFYKETVKGLCGGTTYEFAAWMLNILKQSSCGGNGIDPNITFSIENTSGTVLKSYTTGDIPETGSAEWKQFGFYFTADADEVVIRMTNNAVGGCGNDLALDDITFRACGPKILADAKTSSVNNKFCEGEKGTVILNAPKPAGYLDPAYQWQVNSNDGNGWQDLTGATRTSYTLNIPALNAEGYQFRLAVAEGSNISSANCRIVSEAIPVAVNKKPLADAGPDIIIEEGESVILKGKSEGNSLRYSWNPSSYLNNMNVLEPTATPPQTTSYTLTVMSDDGCNNIARDGVVVRVLKKVQAPNAFTPNGDQINDLWKIPSLESYPEAEITVFNRYGQRVFRSQGYVAAWDGNYEGRPLPAAVYYYIIDLKVKNRILKGAVSIIR
jgi:gliding motility-associated-like protein